MTTDREPLIVAVLRWHYCLADCRQTVGECVDSGTCGCTAGLALAAADALAPPPVPSWTCAARAQGTAAGNFPADCDWPGCGCDPHATKVIAALEESGHLGTPAPPPVPEDVLNKLARMAQALGARGSEEELEGVFWQILSAPPPVPDGPEPEYDSAAMLAAAERQMPHSMAVVGALLDTPAPPADTEARLARAREALERAGERFRWFEGQVGMQSQYYLRDRARAYAEEVARALDCSEPACRADQEGSDA